MKTHAIRAQLRGIGRCATTGILVGLLATQAFALNAPAASTNDSQPSASTLQLTTQTPDLPLISEDSATPDASLPSAPAPIADPSTVSSQVQDKMDLMLDPAAASGSSSTTSSTTAPKKHKIRPGMLALGIVGAAAAGMGAYIFSIKTTDTGAKDALGTMFLAPGAAAAGLGFYFAFK